MDSLEPVPLVREKAQVKDGRPVDPEDRRLKLEIYEELAHWNPEDADCWCLERHAAR